MLNLYNPVDARICFTFGLLLFVFFNDRIAAEAVEALVPEQQQAKIQDILNEVPITSERGASMIQATGPVGELLVKFVEYIRDPEPDESLKPIVNYRILEWLGSQR